MTGAEIYLKLDNVQRTGAFKERGALNKILTLTDSEKHAGVVAASAGNHAQAVAYHACARGIRAQIVMPLMTPLVKVAATKGFGADVVLHGANYDEAYCICAGELCSTGNDVPASRSMTWRSSMGREASVWNCWNRCLTSKLWWCPSAAGG